MLFSNLNPRFGAIAGLIFTAALAFFMQVQINILETETSRGIRLYLSDILIPLAGLFVLWSLLLGQTRWPNWRMRGTWIWLTGLTLVFTGALVNGYLYDGQWSRWAVFNKYVGWFVLLAYLGLGGWLATNYGNVFLSKFFKYFAAVLLVILAIDLGLSLYRDFFLEVGVSRLDGLMKNSNAYVLLLLSGTAVVTVLAMRLNKDSFFYRGLGACLWFLLPFTIYMNSSRAAMIVSVTTLVIFLVGYRLRFIKNMVIWAIFGCLLLSALLYTSDKPFFRKNQIERTMAVYQVKIKGENTARDAFTPSENVRLRVLDDALDLWADHKLLGAGLGSFLSYSQHKYAGDKTVIIDIIDFTLLWLLTEMGGIGASLFLMFYILALYSLWRRGRHKDENAVFYDSILMLMVVFGLMSLFHELLYTRYLWFFMGMGLACLPRERAVDKDK